MSQAPEQSKRETPGSIRATQLVLVVASQGAMVAADHWVPQTAGALRVLALACAVALAALSLFWVLKGPSEGREQHLAYIVIAALAALLLLIAPVSLW